MRIYDKNYFTLHRGEVTPTASFKEQPTLQELIQRPMPKIKKTAHAGIISGIGAVCVKGKHSNCWKASCACTCHRRGV